MCFGFTTRRLFAITAISALSTACGAFGDEEKITIKVSNTFGDELGPALVAEYRKQHPNVAIELESKGSASGFAALLAGECDMASSSRTANEDDQRLAKSSGIELKDYLIGFYGVGGIRAQI